MPVKAWHPVFYFKNLLLFCLCLQSMCKKKARKEGPRMEQLKKIEFFLRHSRSERGIWKTIDENRELLQCLQTNAPEALEKCPWIEGWIAGTDIFLVDLMILFGLEREQPGGPCFPRPWPGKFPVADLYGYGIAASIRNSSTQS